MKRNNTVYIRAGQEESRQHKGVQIDIFVLDNMPDGYIVRRINRGLTFFFRKILWSHTGKRVSANLTERAIYHIMDLLPASVAFWGFDTVAKIHNRKPCKLVRHYAMTYPTPKVNGYGIPADLLSSYTELEFEGCMFKAVSDFERYLSLLYCDYTKLPPEDKRKPHIHLSAFSGVEEE